MPASIKADDKYILALLSHPSSFSVPLGESEDMSVGGKTRVQNIMYMVSKAYPEVDYGFESHAYGMYSQRLDDALNKYAESDIICLPKEGGGPIHLTKDGLRDAKTHRYDSDVCGALADAREFLCGMTCDEMIAFMYAKYPEMKEFSEILDQYEESRTRAAMSLFQDGKVSLSLAIEISGMSAEKFEDMLDENAVPLYPPARAADDTKVRARIA